MAPTQPRGKGFKSVSSAPNASTNPKRNELVDLIGRAIIEVVEQVNLPRPG
jgi:hypothetical protein